MLVATNEILLWIIRVGVTALAMGCVALTIFHIYCHIRASRGSVRHIRFLTSSCKEDEIYDLPPEHRKLKMATDHLDDCFNKYGSHHELTLEARKMLSEAIEEFNEKASSES